MYPHTDCMMHAWLKHQIRDESTLVHRVARACNDVFYNRLGLGGTLLDTYVVAPVKASLVTKVD